MPSIPRLRRQIEQYDQLAQRDGPDSIYHALRDAARDKLVQAINDARGRAPSIVDHTTHVIVGDHAPEPRVF